MAKTGRKIERCHRCTPGSSKAEAAGSRPGRPKTTAQSRRSPLREVDLAILDQAALVTRRDIIEASSGARGTIRHLLEHLGERIVDPDFTREKWMKECNVTYNSIEAEFHYSVGQPPAFYLWDRRMELAARILRRQDVSLERAAEMLGYSRPQTLDKAFERWAGLRANRYKKKVQEVLDSLGEPSEDFLTTSFLQKTIIGSLEPDKALELLNRLIGVPPFLKHVAVGPPDNNNPEGRRDLDYLAVEELWAEIKLCSYSHQVLILSNQLHLDPLVISKFLQERSLLEGRRNRFTGVRLAELALASIVASRRLLDPGLFHCSTEGWVCLGNACYLAGDFWKAEEAFSQARWQLRRLGAEADPLVEAELNLQEGALRWYQRRHDVAIARIEEASGVFRVNRQNSSVAKCLIIKACIYRDNDRPKDAIPLFQEALALIQEQREIYLSVSAFSGLAHAYTLNGQHPEAHQALSSAEKLCGNLTDNIATFQLRWTRGLLRWREGYSAIAEKLLIEARAGFVKFNEPGYAGVVSLDLAMLCFAAGDFEDVIQLVKDALPLLEQFKLQGETLAAVKVLRDSIDRREVALSALKDVRSCFDHIQPGLCPNTE